MTSATVNELPAGAITIVLGTRPEIIKLAHIIRLLGSAATVIHTGQHYDQGLSGSFLDVFGLDEPAAFLGVGGKTRGAQIGNGVTALDEYLEAADETRLIVVQGDTNAALAGGLAANAREIPLAHVEAGLRSRDRRMPEEHNRVLVDHLSDLMFAPTPVAERNLLDEGIPRQRIRVTGNTIVEAVGEILPERESRLGLLAAYGLEPNSYILSTFHRPENVDDPERFALLLKELGSIGVRVMLPLHPRSQRMAREHGLTDLLDLVEVIEPIGYRDFLALGAESAFLISDSGGVQEEVSVYKKPVIVVRRSTERPEVLGTFAELVEPGPEISRIANEWLHDLEGLHASLESEPSPYGDGSASTTIIEEIEGFLDSG